MHPSAHPWCRTAWRPTPAASEPTVACFVQSHSRAGKLGGQGAQTGGRGAARLARHSRRYCCAHASLRPLGGPAQAARLLNRPGRRLRGEGQAWGASEPEQRQDSALEMVAIPGDGQALAFRAASAAAGPSECQITVIEADRLPAGGAGEGGAGAGNLVESCARGHRQ